MSAPPLERRHSIFYAKIIDQFDSKDRAEGLARLKALGGLGLNRFALLDDSGRVIYPASDLGGGANDEPMPNLGQEWKTIPKPEHAYELSAVGSPFQSLIRFPGEPVQYLFVGSGRGRPQSSTVALTTFASLAVSALIGVALAMLVLFKSLRDQAQLADSVIAELQRGNLKARFPIRRLDEIGLAMSRFNKMADEIERLVEQLRNVERSRMALLQELAHDLRTPVASLKNLLETLQSAQAGGGALDPGLRDELMGLALKETDYFERLVEDLLVLAQVSEPRYLPAREVVDLKDLLDEETDGLAARRAGKLRVVKELGPRGVLVQGDPQLLRRMLRNALDNAFSFARGEVRVRLEQAASGEARISVEDDGPGLSPEALASYGERRVSRVLGTQAGSERLSVGLGSVIIKTVARSHGGEALASNRVDRGGASVSIRLPISR
jgi:signal transduction histidine kinase